MKRRIEEKIEKKRDTKARRADVVYDYGACMCQGFYLTAFSARPAVRDAVPVRCYDVIRVRKFYSGAFGDKSIALCRKYREMEARHE